MSAGCINMWTRVQISKTHVKSQTWRFVTYNFSTSGSGGKDQRIPRLSDKQNKLKLVRSRFSERPYLEGIRL